MYDKFIMASILVVVCVYYLGYLLGLNNNVVFYFEYKIYSPDHYNPQALSIILDEFYFMKSAKFNYLVNDEKIIILNSFVSDIEKVWPTVKRLREIKKKYYGRYTVIAKLNPCPYFPNK